MGGHAEIRLSVRLKVQSSLALCGRARQDDRVAGLPVP